MAHDEHVLPRCCSTLTESEQSCKGSADDLSQRKVLVDAAILEELRIWVESYCFEIAFRSTSKTTMTSLSVAMWEIFIGRDARGHRIIRLRMALRGFLDRDKCNFEIYAGTAQRVSHRVRSTQAACHEDGEAKRTRQQAQETTSNEAKVPAIEKWRRQGRV